MTIKIKIITERTINLSDKFSKELLSANDEDLLNVLKGKYTRVIAI